MGVEIANATPLVNVNGWGYQYDTVVPYPGSCSPGETKAPRH